MKRIITFVALCAALISCRPTADRPTADAFVRIDGTDLVQPDGQKLFIRGTNLGNWLNPEGYMFGFSRTNFYRKIKALTGVTPNDLLRVCRLNRAAQLLLTREYTIGEISDMTGFGTQSHFSNLFKRQFGVTPRDYLLNHTSNPADSTSTENPPVADNFPPTPFT